ncbi:MAG: hypothetical protein JWM57_192, partial [Phycisphaerales bacterium]|nr:hypothetical protein [Phycisphaerales bacterium]
NGGKAAAPFDVADMAYDRGRGALYVTEESVDHSSVRIARFNSTGELDSDFGAGGQQAYTPGVGGDPSIKRTITCESMTILRNGGVLIGANVVGSKTESGQGNVTDPVGYSSSYTYDETLIRFRQDGHRDRRTGRRGVVVIASGREDNMSDGYDNSSGYDVPTLRTATPTDDGGFRVVSTRETGTNATYYGNIPTEAFSVNLQTFDASGHAATAAAAWNIVQGKSRGAVVGEHVIDRGRQIELTDSATGGLYVLQPGKRPANRLLNDPAGFFSNGRLPDRHGGYFITGVTRETGLDEPAVLKIRRNGQVETGWGDHGLLHLGLFSNVIVDADERLVGTDGYQIARFDGWPDRRPPMPL